MSVVTNLFDDGDGKHCLMVMEGSDQTFAVFEQLGLQGGGYTWEGIIRSLIDHQMTDMSEFDLGAEADNAYVYSTSEVALKELRGLIVGIDQDAALLRNAISQADENLE